MIVREDSLILKNVICVEEIIPHEEWFKPALSLRRNLVNEDIYSTSPIVFKAEEMENEPAFGKYTYYIGINTEVEVAEGAGFRQLDFVEIFPAIYERCAEIEESFYHVCFDIFDCILQKKNAELCNEEYIMLQLDMEPPRA